MSSIDRLHSLLRLACKSGNGYPAERQSALERAISHAKKYSVDIQRVIKELGIDLEGLRHSFVPNSTRAKSTASSYTPPKPQRSPNRHSSGYYWSDRSGERSYRVPYVMNPRWTSSRRRYRDNEVTHGFPIDGITEFFFFSTSIVSAGYDPNSYTLFLKFSERDLYRYTNVPENVVKSLIEAQSLAVSHDDTYAIHLSMNELLGKHSDEFGKANKPRHATARSRSVDMISLNYNPKPVSDFRSRS